MRLLLAVGRQFSCGLGPLLCLVTWLSVPVAGTDQSAAAEPVAAEVVGRFLDRYCLDCHSGSEAEAGRNLETLRLLPDSAEQLALVDDVLLQLELRQMPPPDGEQPDSADRRAVTAALRQGIAAVRSRFDNNTPRATVRRLSIREYENTLASLFGRRVDTLGLTTGFPRENAEGSFDTIAAGAVPSGFLLDRLFWAADRLVEYRLGGRSVVGAAAAGGASEPQTWTFTDNFKQYEELTRAHRRVFNFESLCLYEQPNTDTRQGGYAHIEDFLEGVPLSGRYVIAAQAQAFHRDTHYDPKIFRIDFSEPFQLAVVPGDATKGHIHYPQAVEPVLATAIVPDDEPTWLRFEVWLEAGQTPRFIFPNGPYESRASVQEINRRYKDEFDPKTYRSGVERTHILQEGALPHIRIDEVTITGPLPEPGGSREERAVFGPDGFVAERAAEQLLAFAERAFRRPLEPSEADRIRAFSEAARKADGATPRQAALDTVKLVLCSPAFLSLGTTGSGQQGQLEPLDLAARLSYALWGRLPDEALLTAAAAGDLAGPAGRRQHVERLLRDDRADEFVAAFLDGWLQLHTIGSFPPPRPAAREYYAEDLPSSMKQEARLFFRHLLETDGPLESLLAADFTYVDKKLARLYKLPEQKTLRLADGFTWVPLRSDSHRGGLLGMAAVLTASANGVETSPVTRGVWVSEAVLGISPPPPPPDVPAIDANVSGAKTIREKLALHSQDTSCAGCHRKIDPLGYGLERFDPIGRWRSRYPKGQGGKKIDPSGEFPSGETYAGFESFRKQLRAGSEDRLRHTLVEELLAYATGRPMERADEFEIADLAARLRNQQAGLRTLVVETLSSEIVCRP